MSAIVWAASAPTAAKEESRESIAILPAEVTLNGRLARQQLLVERLREGQYVGQITNAFRLVSSDTNVVRIEAEGVLLPVTNGTAMIRAEWEGASRAELPLRQGAPVDLGLEARTAEVAVTVQRMDLESEWSFRNHVQPVLARMGCSSGACHGAAAGQNGFRLSLRGYDDAGDYLSLTRHAWGRRIIPSDPGRSLLLLKPTGTVPHKGGKRFEIDSDEYRVLAGWIAAGTPPPKPDDPKIQQIELLPPQVILTPGARQQLLVRAHFSDGHVEDVTRWAKFTSANESVAQVAETGQVNVTGRGEAGITAWYLSRIALATVAVPYTNPAAPAMIAAAPRRNFIDDLVLEKLASLNLPPSPRSADEEFLRRAYLDTLGVLPTAGESREFLGNSSAGKRDALIAALLGRPEYVDYWSYKWSDLFLVQSRRLKPAAMWAFYRWIRQNVAANTPWDKFVRQLVLAQGSTLENGAANFFVLHEDPRLMAETVSQAFLGMSVNCAKCHNHPMEKWTNDEYYGFANLFARVRLKNGEAEGDTIVFASSRGEVIQPLTGRAQPPRPLEGDTLPMDDPGDRRAALADWLVGPDNRYFARAIVNRVWANYLGMGLVDPVDDLRATNPSSNEKLLSALARYLVEQKFDLKAVMRLILQSETYQRSSKAIEGNAAESRFYSRFYPRRLMAEVLLDALSQATGAPTAFKGYPENWRAIQLPDSNIDSYFLKAFGRPEREKTCDCERTADPNVTQVLHLANGDTLNQKLGAKENRLAQMLRENWTPERIIDEAYLSTLARFPTAAETAKLLPLLSETPGAERRPVLEDIYWALLSSREFLFNH